MINISFAITVCNEAFELDRLLNQLDKCVVEDDEVVIQVDKNNTTSEVLEIISSYEGKYNPVISRPKEKIVSPTKVFYSLNNDFAEFKNNIKKHCTNDYIFFIDADEEVTQDQIHLIREILELNSNIDCFLVPRINTVEGLTDEHIKQWGWKVTEDGWINWPDMQFRLCRNTPEIKWEGKVHERLNGYKTISQLPAESILALQHHKTIQKQELQNNFYNAI
jgi:glycosyltransferase involved in cell wall biosynthesis